MAKDARTSSSTTEKDTEGGSGELAGLRIAILAETLYEDLELWYPYYRLREAGADVFVVGSGSAETYQSKHGYPVTVDAEAGYGMEPRELVDRPRAILRRLLLPHGLEDRRVFDRKVRQGFRPRAEEQNRRA